MYAEPWPAPASPDENGDVPPDPHQDQREQLPAGATLLTRIQLNGAYVSQGRRGDRGGLLAPLPPAFAQIYPGAMVTLAEDDNAMYLVYGLYQVERYMAVAVLREATLVQPGTPLYGTLPPLMRGSDVMPVYVAGDAWATFNVDQVRGPLSPPCAPTLLTPPFPLPVCRALGGEPRLRRDGVRRVRGRHAAAAADARPAVRAQPPHQPLPPALAQAM